MKTLRVAVFATITAVVSTLGLIAAPVSATAPVNHYFNSLTDYSCGQPGKVSLAATAATTRSPGVNQWLVDSYSSIGATPTTAHNPWAERVLADTEPLSVAGKELARAQRAQIGYLVNWLGQDQGTQEAALRYGPLWRAIGMIAGVATAEPACAYLNEPAQQAVSRVAGITGPGSGELRVVPEISDYDPDTGTFAVRDIAIVDVGNGFDVTSLFGSRFDFTLSVSGGSLTTDGTTTSTTVTTQSGNMPPITIYADRPGGLTIATEALSNAPSTDLRIFDAPGAARQFGAADLISPTSDVRTLLVPEPALEVAATNITQTSASLLTVPSPKFIQGQHGAVLALTAPTGSQTRTVRLDESTHEFSGLTPNTRYTVAYTRTDGLAAAASTVFTTGPVAPTNLRTVAAPNSLRVSWQPAPGATSYEVTVGDITRTVTGTTTQITGLKPATSYPIRIEALNPPARGGSTTGRARTTLATPGKVTVTRATAKSVTLSWPQVPSATRYRITLDGHQGVWEPAALSATLTGLAQARSYTGTLTALADGETPSTSRFSFTTAPSTVTGIRTTRATPTSLSLAWRSGSVGTRYTVKVTGPKGKTVTVTAADATISGLRANTPYKVSVQATNTNGTSSWSPALTLRTAKKARVKIAGNRSKKKTKIIIKGTIGARANIQIQKGKRWRTVKKLRTKKTTLITTKVSRRAQLRVTVRATATTRHTTKVLR